VKLGNVLSAVEKWRLVICPMLLIGGVEEAFGVLDGMEGSSPTSVRIVVMWNSISRSEEMMGVLV
jgi:hypothetical protein